MVMGFTVAAPLDELLIERAVEALGSEDVVHVAKSCVETNVVPLENK
jgi:hypothetical protein